MTYPIFLVQVLQPLQITRNCHCQTARDSTLKVALVHVLKRSSRRSFTIVYRLIVAVCIAHKCKAAATYSRVVHADDSHTQLGSHMSISCVPLVYVLVFAKFLGEGMFKMPHTPCLRISIPICEHIVLSLATAP